MARACSAAAVIAMMTGLSGCKSFTERYIALEVWKYEKCFGHYPPGFTPPGAAAAAAPARVCGQGNPCPPANTCDPCQGGMGGMMEGGMMEGGMPMPPGGIGLPSGPGGSPGPSAGLPTPSGITTGRPVVISDEVVLP
jgi:hypothetical protein